MPASRSLRVSAPAAEDLSSIATYTRREWGDEQTSRYLAKIQDTFANLRDTPGLGRVRNRLSENLRSFPVGRHVIYFRDTETALLIIRVLHQNMDPERHLDKE